MISWFLIILIVAAVLVILKFLHFRHLKHRIVGIVIVLLVLFLVSTIYLVSNKNNVDMTTVSGFTSGMKVYGGWLAHSYQNVKTLAGNAIKMDWSSVNGSFFKVPSKK